MPFAIFKLETDDNRKKSLKQLMALGVLVSLVLGYNLITHSVVAKMIGQHIYYQHENVSQYIKYGGFVYALATIIPFFLSSAKKMWIVGSTILISYVVTLVFYEDFVVSIWCFFSSIISLAVLWVIHNMLNLSNKPITKEI